MKLIEIKRTYVNSDGVQMNIAKVKEDNGAIITRHLTDKEVDSLEVASTISAIQENTNSLDDAYLKEMMEEFSNVKDELPEPANVSSDHLVSKNYNELADKEVIKNGELKPKMSLIPQLAMKEVAKVLTYGEAKYERFNYSKEQYTTTYIDACLRHVNEFLMNKNIDDESGLNHLAHAAANLLICLDNFINKNYIDDRNPHYKQ